MRFLECTRASGRKPEQAPASPQRERDVWFAHTLHTALCISLGRLSCMRRSNVGPNATAEQAKMVEIYGLGSDGGKRRPPRQSALRKTPDRESLRNNRHCPNRKSQPFSEEALPSIGSARQTNNPRSKAKRARFRESGRVHRMLPPIAAERRQSYGRYATRAIGLSHTATSLSEIGAGSVFSSS